MAGLAYSAGRRLFWALTWGVGVAIGVAAGGWLTIVGGQGAPGTEALDVTSDLVILPLIVGSLVAVAHFVGGLLVTGLRSVRTRRSHREHDEHQQSEGE